MAPYRELVDQRTFHKLASAGDAADVSVERPAQVLRSGDEGSRTVRFVLSDSSVDRVGDTIDAAGWRLGPYKQNPVVLWAHDSSSPPIGKMVNIFVSGDRLIGDVRFAEPEVYEFSDQVLRLIRAGYIKAGSVGFTPLSFSFAQDADRAFGIDFHEQELLEFSVVPVPANAHALIEARAKGWRRGALAERTEPVPSVMGFAGTSRERHWLLAHHLRQLLK
jgi:HK97 family phage prohead protease